MIWPGRLSIFRKSFRDFAMKIEFNWKVTAVIGLLVLIGGLAVRYESVALMLTEKVAAIISAIGLFTL